MDRAEWTCIAAQDRSATRQVTTAAANATGPGALSEPRSNVLPGGR